MRDKAHWRNYGNQNWQQRELGLETSESNGSRTSNQEYQKLVRVVELGLNTSDSTGTRTRNQEDQKPVRVVESGLETSERNGTRTRNQEDYEQEIGPGTAGLSTRY